MSLRPLDWTLLAIVVIGGGLALQTGWERGRLTRERDRLVQITGELTVAEPAKLHIKAIATGIPLDFAWRIYIPPNYQFKQRASAGGTGSSLSSNARDFVGRVRFRRDDRGYLQVFSRFGSGNSVAGIGGERLAKLLENRWGEVRVEQLGATEPVSLDSGQFAVLLRLSLPDYMLDESPEKLTPADLGPVVPIVYELKLGPDPPK
jgi:hypothetical protein